MGQSTIDLIGCSVCGHGWRYPQEGERCPRCHGIPIVADLLKRVESLERCVNAPALHHLMSRADNV